MFFSEIAHAMGSAAGGSGGQPGNPLMSILPLVLMFVVFYFLLIRPQQKKQKEHRNTLASLKVGDRVLTGGGLYGTITKIKEDVLTIEIAENVRIKVNRSYVAGMANTGAQQPADEKKGE